MHYFVRVNGDTAHNNPNEPDFYVPNEPPPFPRRSFNYLDFCLARNIVRIGWPDTGDLRKGGKTGALANGYSLGSLSLKERGYLEGFRDIARGSVILMPDRARPGDLYIGEVREEYHYHHNVPSDPYECAHRLGVEWDRDRTGRPIIYRADQLNIPIGGFWLRAFHHLEESPSGRAAIPAIRAARAARR